MQGAFYRHVLKHLQSSTAFFQKNESFGELADNKKKSLGYLDCKGSKHVFKSKVTTFFKHL